MTDPTPTTTVESPVVSEQTTQTERQRIAAKYEQTYYTAPETDTQTVQEPTTQETVTETVPVATETTPVTPNPTPDVTSVLQALVARLEGLETRMAPATVPTPVQESAPAPQEDWLKLLAEGKKEEGERALLAKLGPEIQRAAVQEALNRSKMEHEVETFVNDVRSKNPDLMAMEPYITAAAQQRIAQAHSAGKIKTPADYVTVYKQAVTAEIENARNLVRTFRGDGKLEATTRVTELTSQPTIKPNPVNTNREQAKPQTEQIETPEDYMAKRKLQFARNTGIGA